MRRRLSLSLIALGCLVLCSCQEDTKSSEVVPVYTAVPQDPSKLGLKIVDQVVGTGDVATAGQTVTVNYTGWLASNHQKFDSSYDRNQAFSFQLGAGQVIKGWDLGVAGMKVGGKRELTIPSSLGYGSQGAGGGLIPPDADLVFDVELLGVK
jgi:FKBP-type peptidyl-prolyl cis-trans isomerase